MEKNEVYILFVGFSNLVVDRCKTKSVVVLHNLYIDNSEQTHI